MSVARPAWGDHPTTIVPPLSFAGMAAAAPRSDGADAQRSFDAHVEAGLAHEVTHARQIKIGEASLILLPGDRVTLSDMYRSVEASANATTRCGEKVGCVGSLYWDSRTGARTSDFDTSFARGDAGVQYAAGSIVYGVKAGREQWDVGGRSFRSVTSVTGEIVTALSTALSFYGSATAARYRHPGDTSAFDADYRAVTGNLRWGTSGAWDTAYTLQMAASREGNRAGDAALDVRGLLVRVAWEAKPAPRWELRSSIIRQSLGYGAMDSSFGVKRADRYTSVDFTPACRLTDNLKLRIALAYARYESNAEVLRNTWYSVGASVQYDF